MPKKLTNQDTCLSVHDLALFWFVTCFVCQVQNDYNMCTESQSVASFTLGLTVNQVALCVGKMAVFHFSLWLTHVSMYSDSRNSRTRALL